MKKKSNTTLEFQGFVRDNGDGDISMQCPEGPDKIVRPCDQLDKELVAFEKRNVKVTLTINIEEV